MLISRRLLYLVLPVMIGLIVGTAGAARAQIILQRGDVGAEVETLQLRLQDLGYLSGPVDGVYGPLTEDAVFLLQRDSGIAPDGVYGPETEAVLLGSPSPSGTFATFDTPSSFSSFDTFVSASPGSRVVQFGDSGSDVETLQSELNRLGYNAGVVDGTFGATTESAVIAFQQANGLTPDGVVGTATWSALGYGGEIFPTPSFPTFPGDTATGADTGGLTIVGLPEQGPYVVAVPADRDDLEELRQARRVVTGSRFASSSRGFRGLFIYAGSYANRSQAEAVSLRLRSLGLDSRVEYFRDIISYR